LASVSHELRTPLNCIVAMLDMVDKFITDDLKEDYIQPAADSAKLLLSLINDILDFSQSKAKTLRLNFLFFNLKQHLLDIIKLMTIQAKGKGLELNLYYDERVPFKIYSDPNRVRQVVINLIGNALKFTTKGAISIRVMYCEANVCRISVSDTGIGIKPDDMKQLFKKFSKISESHRMNQQGVGLGLVISNMLAKKLGPHSKPIQVESKYGSGTTFSFELESKVYLAMSKEFDNDISSDEEELLGNVTDNVNGIKEKNKRADIQKMRLFERRLSHPFQGRQTSKDPSIVKSLPKKVSYNFTSNQKSDSQIPPFEFARADDECSSPYLKEPPPKITLYTPTVKTISKTQIEALVNSNPMIPKFSLSLSADDRVSSFGGKSPIRSRTVFDEEGFTKHMDERAKFIHRVSSKLNMLNSDDPYILIVDDNAFNIIALKKILEGLNMKTDSATSGDLAIQKILERKTKSDKQTYKIIFMDCSMPIKDGYTVTREIRDLQEKGVINTKVQIVAVTASNYPSDIKKCYDSGMDDYVTKPVSLDMMKNMLAKHMANETA